MHKKTLDDGTVLVASYDDGFRLHVYCACTGEDDEPLFLESTDYVECSGCGKRYETMLIPRVDVTVNGSYEESF